MSASGRKRPLKTAGFCWLERPLSGKADIQGTAQNFHKIDQLGTSAFRPEADIRLVLSKRSANDPKRPNAIVASIVNRRNFNELEKFVAVLEEVRTNDGYSPDGQGRMSLWCRTL